MSLLLKQTQDFTEEMTNLSVSPDVALPSLFNYIRPFSVGLVENTSGKGQTFALKLICLYDNGKKEVKCGSMCFFPLTLRYLTK